MTIICKWIKESTNLFILSDKSSTYLLLQYVSFYLHLWKKSILKYYSLANSVYLVLLPNEEGKLSLKRKIFQVSQTNQEVFKMTVSSLSVTLKVAKKKTNQTKTKQNYLLI